MPPVLVQAALVQLWTRAALALCLRLALSILRHTMILGPPILSPSSHWRWQQQQQAASQLPVRVAAVGQQQHLSSRHATAPPCATAQRRRLLISSGEVGVVGVAHYHIRRRCCCFQMVIRASDRICLLDWDCHSLMFLGIALHT